MYCLAHVIFIYKKETGRNEYSYMSFERVKIRRYAFPSACKHHAETESYI